MYIIPTYLLVVNQQLGIFPLNNVINPEGEKSIKFFRSLFIRGIILVSCITASTLYALYVDMEAYFTGQNAVRMKRSMVATLADVLPLMMDLFVMFSSSVNKHHQFTEMCNVLQTTDKDLCLCVQHSTFKLRIPIAYTFITTLVLTVVVYSMFDPRYIFYAPVQCINIMQAAWFLQFTFLVHTITARFQMINKMIKEEIIQANQQENNIYSARLSSSYSLKILIDSYNQMCTAVEKAKDFYGGQILVKVSYAFAHIVISLYYFFLNFQVTTEMTKWIILCLFGAWSIAHILHLLLLILPCAALTDTVEKTASMISSLMNENKKVNNKEVICQLETFLVQLLHHDVQFSALGLFPIHRHIITPIVSSVATYLVVIIQMHTSTTNSTL